MTGRTHLTIGIAVGLALASSLRASPEHTAQIVLGASIAALLPDIDHPRSMLSGWIPGSGLFRLFVRHRGITHSLLFCLLPLLVPLIRPQADRMTLVACGLGYVSHLLADMLTPAGVPLLLPLSGRNFKLAPGFVLRIVKWTGLEALVFVGALAVIALLIKQKIPI